MGNVPATTWVTGVGRIGFKLGRVYIDFNRCPGDEEFPGTYRTKLILLVDVLGHVIDP